jgi:hypothetical protein
MLARRSRFCRLEVRGGRGNLLVGVNKGDDYDALCGDSLSG